MNLVPAVAPGELGGDAFFDDPYPCYAQLRAQRAPYWLAHRQDTSSGGVWLFSRYEDAVAIFRQKAGITKNIRSARPDGYRSTFDVNVLHRDGADHLRLRRLVGDYFSGKAIERLRPKMVAVANGLLDPLRRKTEFDLVAELAEPLPLAIIAAVIGVPEEDMAQVRAWSLELGEGFDSLLSNDGVLDRQKQAMRAFFLYVERLIEARLSAPDDSLLSMLVQAQGQRLDREELAAMIGFLLFAGHETTVNLIGNAVWLLLSHPDQWALLRAQPALVPGAIEEVLRFESPEQRTSYRRVTEALTINGHRLEPGQQIGLIIGSANRDEAAFEQADRFDIRRAPNRHLAFGLGAHNCLGKTLARAEAQVCVDVLLSRAPGLTRALPAARWRRNSFFRGQSELRVHLDGLDTIG